MNKKERARQDGIANFLLNRIATGFFNMNPATRLEHFAAARTEICEAWAEMNATYKNREVKRAIFGFAAVLATTLIGAVVGAATVASSVPAFLTFIGAGAIYAVALPDWKERRFKKNFLGLSNALIGLDMAATTQIQKTVEKHTVDVALRVDIFTKHPDIGAMFEIAVQEQKDARRNPLKPGTEPKP